jgi:hypothetical protein
MEIVSGYNRKCKDSLGGVKTVWLLKWVKYSRSQIITTGNYLTTFPETFIFRFDSVTQPTANEQQQQNEGCKFFEQSITMSFKAKSSREFDQIIKSDWRVLVLDNNGLYRLFGLYNGMQSGAIDFKSGGAKNELNGYSFTLTGQEEHAAYFILDPFDLGLTEEEFFLLFQNNDFFMTQNNDFFMIQNNYNLS